MKFDKIYENIWRQMTNLVYELFSTRALRFFSAVRHGVLSRYLFSENSDVLVKILTKMSKQWGLDRHKSYNTVQFQ